jgi:hypothetical protein
MVVQAGAGAHSANVRSGLPFHDARLDDLAPRDAEILPLQSVRHNPGACCTTFRLDWLLPSPAAPTAASLGRVSNDGNPSTTAWHHPA